MVFYFESNVISPPVLIYVGRDKHENEDLIRWGWPEDVWFHTDKLSSAHIYLRLPEGMTIDTIPAELLTDCCQLTKANSIEGCKQNNVAIVYTPWANLKKTGDMAVGQVGFQKQKEVRRIMVETKINVIINRLNKTKVEKEIDYRALREQRDQAEQREAKKKIQEEKALKKLAEAEKAEQKELKNYSSLMVESNMTSNVDNPIDEDDFM
ncbi:coiled-coil domain-containing protein 25-like [Hydractinia symbiolongicarpus]|uniref:coiled-coil domain-containing protein 25-like n=1 Tax=Hydractinia symbiolongicarpus TaxID=13093 RepID=UPI00254FCA4D|nr:coiled-coil domain-containing protein 25-like [Hydractinia symbiolongicarpus]